MLDLKFTRANLDVVREALGKRNSKLDADEFAVLDERRRELLREVEALKAERNAASGEIVRRKKAGEDASDILARMAAVSERAKALDGELSGVEEREKDWLLSVPNIPHESVPAGKDENDNPVVRVWGEPTRFDFAPRDHHDLGTGLGMLDFERAAKLSGARFAVISGQIARLERALAAFMLDVQTREHGYLEVIPPTIVNADSLLGTGNLPKFEEDLFKLTDSRNFYLIPTAEVPLTNLYRGEVLDEDDLPKAFCAHTSCFRSEAGSYGKDTRGLIRQHEFRKVEMVRYSHPDKSYETLELMTGHAEAILQKLGLPYRVVLLCTGDMGFSSAKTYDLEVWLPAQDKYREISSCSNCVDFHARRADIRFKPKGGKKTEFVHTLNGSGLAVGRTLVAVMENYQNADGSIRVPEALKPYMGGIEIIGGAGASPRS
jgi:seryl-tRNA synthetase